MASAMLAGCATPGAPGLSANGTEAARATGQQAQAIAAAETAVQADPRNAALRAGLGSAYLDAGRFASAATSFDDAMQLGDDSPRTVLSLALAQIGQGRDAEAAMLLNQHEDRIAAADVGLALALAGQPGRGVHLMSNAIRGGDNNAKIRQNLAYAYALAGQWREARLMAEQDVPGDKVGDRLEQWAVSAHPGAFQYRVATLLQVPADTIDAGQPIQLALASSPEAPMLAVAEPAELPPVAAAPVAELPALAAVAPAPVSAAAPAPAPAAGFQAAFAGNAPAPVAQDAAHFAQRAPAPARAPATPAAANGTHLVQLGSFASEAGARRAWGLYQRKYPELAGHQLVRGKRYWRVSAAGFARSSAASMCGKVRSSGAGCFAYAEGRPLPGAVDTGVRLARR
jgi:Flp pilus assembly protein TadD